jgi:hypothetical protein
MVTAPISRSGRSARAVDQLELLRVGMPAQDTYVLPRVARAQDQRFIQRLQNREWGFLLVYGDNGAGKSAYLRHMEAEALALNYAAIHAELNQDDVRRYGGSPWFSLVLLQQLRLPDGQLLRWRLENDVDFRAQLHALVDENRSTLSFWSPALCTILSWATQDSDVTRMQLAQSWLRGESLYVADLRTLDIYDSAMKSLLHVPPDRTVHFMNALVRYLGASGLLLSVDEVERAGYLSPVRGREVLSSIRDLINVLVDDTAQPNQKGIVSGVFISFAISTFFLGYSNILRVDGVDFRAQAERVSRPKVSLGDVPRLARVLEHNAARLDTDLKDMQDLEQVADAVRLLYREANPDLAAMPMGNELARIAFDRTGTYVAGPNIQEMIHYLDELAGEDN